MAASYADEDEYEEEYDDGEDEGKTYLIGGLPILGVLSGLVFVLSLWRLIDDPSFTILTPRAFRIVMDFVLPIAIITIAMFMVICMINGDTKGSDVVPPGIFTKVVVLFVLYVVIGLLMFWGDAWIQFVAGSFFGTCACFFLAFIVFSVNNDRNPMLAKPPGPDPPTSLSFYLCLVPAGFGLLNAGCYLLFVVKAELSRLTAAKLAATIGFVIIQLIGHKNYPGFSRGEYACYLAGSLGLYVFSFTGVCLWTEEAIFAQAALNTTGY